MDQLVKTNLKTKLDSVYHEKEITVVVVFEHGEDNNINIMGVAKRSWKQPTLEYEMALQHGIEYKSFTLPIASMTNPSARDLGRFNHICETLHISVTNLQMRETAEEADDGYYWCNWIQTLPPPYNDPNSEVARDVVLPQWMSVRCIKEVCKAIVDTRKEVKLARENGRDYEPKKALPPLEFSQNLLPRTEESIRAMKVTNNFYNIVNVKKKGKIGIASNYDKDVIDKEVKIGRAEQEEQEHQNGRYDEHFQPRRVQQQEENQNRLRAEEQERQRRVKQYIDDQYKLRKDEQYHQGRMNQHKEHENRLREGEYQRRLLNEEQRNINTPGYVGGGEHLLDSPPPKLQNEVILLPGLSSPSPHSHPAPVIPTHFPQAPPYPWSNPSHNPDWERKEPIDWNNSQDLLQQARKLHDRAEFLEQQKERERYERRHLLEDEHAKQQRANYESLLLKAKQQQELEEYKSLINKKEKQLLQKAQQQQEKVEHERFKSNITAVINKRVNVMTENQYEEIPDANPDCSQKLHVKMPDGTKPLIGQPPRITKQPSNLALPPPDFHPPLGAASMVNEAPVDQACESPEWSGLRFCGPRFPSLEKVLVNDKNISPNQEARKIVDKQQIEVLRKITEDQLREITNLEGNIHEKIYNTRENQPPCSLLANQNIISASQCPQLLPGDNKEKIKSMKEILALMEEKKQDYVATLRWLQKQPHYKIKELVDENSKGAWDAVSNDEEDNDDDAVDDDDGNGSRDYDQNENRASDRLANKRRIDYKLMHRKGKDDW